MGRGHDADIHLERPFSSTRSNTPSCSTRKSLTCAAAGSSPISSKKRVPSSARSNQPLRVPTAPVKLPFSCPNSSESIRSGGIAPQLTRMNGPAARAERVWIARAMTSFPEPVSPNIRTGRSEGLTSATRSSTGRSLPSAPTIASCTSVRPSRLSRDCLSASAASRRAVSSRSRRSFSSAAATGSKIDWSIC